MRTDLEQAWCANKRLSRDEAGAEVGCMPGGQRCLTHNLWEDLGVAIQDYLSQVSLDDVISEAQRASKVSISDAASEILTEA